MRMLFNDYSSALNTIVPSKLITKFGTLGLNTSLCNRILDFLTGQPKHLPFRRLKRFGMDPQKVLHLHH